MTNINFNGSTWFWFRPRWTSGNLGGSGPEAAGRLVEIGRWSTDASYGWWSLYLDAGGNNIFFSGQTNGQGADYFAMPIQWSSNEWHLIALNYSSTNTALFLDGQLATNGSPAVYWPGAAAQAEGFRIGGDFAGANLAQGDFDGFRTYAEPANAAAVFQHYQNTLPKIQGGGSAGLSSLLLTGAPAENESAGGEMPGGATSTGPRLEIVLWDNDTKRMSFDSQVGLRYQIEESTDLVNWSLLEELVASSDTTVFYSFDSGKRFYRLIQLDDRIQFPDWDDFIEQYLYFDVWTSIQGTYHLELYADGALLHERTQPVPADGFFGVYDGLYDPTYWPNTGYYLYEDWELRVTVTPLGASGEPLAAEAAAATVKKKQRRRNTSRKGITVQQFGVVSGPTTIQDELDEWMLYYLRACAQAAQQLALDGTVLDVEAMDRSTVPTLYGPTWWSQLIFRLYGSGGGDITDLHYFGHGSSSSIGSSLAEGITLNQFKGSKLSKNPLAYVALDGCRTAENSDLLRALIGHSEQNNRDTFKNKGWTPRFGWGWENDKGVAFVQQGVLYDKHFEFVADYYKFLTERDFGGYLQNTYEGAINFGKNPNGGGFNPNRITNPEGDSINYFGCINCRFDE